ALNKHLSPIHKKNLSIEFAGLRAPWKPKVEGRVNAMQFKVAMFNGASSWSFRQHDDQLFFVHRGRLLMQFRDREEIIEPGEFIVVPYGVEHSAVALGEEGCEVLVATSTALPCYPPPVTDLAHSDRSQLTA
ncbi:cupin domain-containing protein, partial [Mesorhizobium sp. M7A.F.Ca.CA.001.12.2.1]